MQLNDDFSVIHEKYIFQKKQAFFTLSLAAFGHGTGADRSYIRMSRSLTANKSSLNKFLKKDDNVNKGKHLLVYDSCQTKFKTQVFSGEEEGRGDG